MKYYKHQLTSQIYAFEADGSQDAFIPQELIPMTESEVQAHLQPPPPTFAQIIEAFESAVQSYLDAKAQAKNYDNINTACSYAGAPNPFQQEGIEFVAMRGNTWAYCYQQLALVQQGERDMPTITEILGELDALLS